MSWGEVMKINSDFANEPLNFNNYINDISTFGKYSYVLDPENSGLWRSLLTQSLTMFGHSAIHETVYDRLTDDDVNYMILHNGRLGESFNSFYDTDSFASGSIDTVLKTITPASYNELEIKLQNGINRYVTAMTADSSAGPWLASIFGVSALSSKTTMASILSDTTLWNNTIMADTSLRYVVCLSASTINWFSSNNSSAFLSFITEVCNSTEATMALFTALTGNSKLATFMSTENAVTIMASKRESMIAITYMPEPFAAMISSTTAMTAVAASETAMDVIVEALTNAAKSETVLNAIKKNLTAIEDSLPNIANSDLNISEVAEVKANIADVILSLQNTTSQTDILVANMAAIVTNGAAMSVIANNDTARTAIENSADACRAMNSLSTFVQLSSSSIVSGSGTCTVYNGLVWISTIKSSSNYSGFFTLYGFNGTELGRYTNTTNPVSVNKFSDRIAVSTTASPNVLAHITCAKY